MMNRISFIFLLGALLSLPFSDVKIFFGSIPFYPPEICVMLSLAAFIIHNRCTYLFAPSKASLRSILPILTLLLGLFLSLAFGGYTQAGFGILKSWFFFPLAFTWLMTQHLRFRSSHIVILTWYFILAATSLFSLHAAVHQHLTYDGRLAFPYASPNYLALFISPGILLGAQLLKEQGRNMYFTLFFLSWLALLVTLVLTFSYAAWIALLGGWCVAFISQTPLQKRTIFAAILFLGITSSLLIASQWSQPKFQDMLSSDRSSLASRLMIWRSAATMLQEHPFLGIGPGNFQTTYLEYQRFFPPYLEWAVPQPHNLLLAFWLQTGLIGLLGFLWLIASWVCSMLRSLTHTTKTSPWRATFLGVMVTILIHGLFDTPYWKTDLAYTFWLVWLLGASLASNPTTSESGTTSRPTD